jgi:Redoxin
MLILALVAAGSVGSFVLPRQGIYGMSVPSRGDSSRTTSLNMSLLNRFRKKKQIQTVESIRPGQSLPEIDVEVVVNANGGADGGGTVSTATIQEIVGGPGTNLLIGMPGAYTPTCTTQLPEYAKVSDKLKKLGVNNIAVVTTNGTLL